MGICCDVSAEWLEKTEEIERMFFYSVYCSLLVLGNENKIRLDVFQTCNTNLLNIYLYDFPSDIT